MRESPKSSSFDDAVKARVAGVRSTWDRGSALGVPKIFKTFRGEHPETPRSAQVATSAVTISHTAGATDTLTAWVVLSGRGETGLGVAAVGVVGTARGLASARIAGAVTRSVPEVCVGSAKARGGA